MTVLILEALPEAFLPAELAVIQQAEAPESLLLEAMGRRMDLPASGCMQKEERMVQVLVVAYKRQVILTGIC